MKLAQASQQKLELFFQQYFNDENLKLPLFQVHCGFWASLITKTFKISGITLGNHIFIAPAFVEREKERKAVVDFDLIVHEATHVLQFQSQGFYGFLFSYLKEWIKFIQKQRKRDLDTRWQAYYSIPHEREARDAAFAYSKWKNEVDDK
jgi:hypothetical protein